MLKFTAGLLDLKGLINVEVLLIDLTYTWVWMASVSGEWWFLFIWFQKIQGDSVQFVNGETAQFDKIVYCTGYKIDLPYFSEDIRNKTLDAESNSLCVSLWFFLARATGPTTTKASEH